MSILFGEHGRIVAGAALPVGGVACEGIPRPAKRKRCWTAFPSSGKAHKTSKADVRT